MIGTGIEVNKGIQSWKNNDSNNDLLTPSKSTKQHSVDIQKDLDDGFKKLETTKWVKTDRGKQVFNAIEKANDAGKIKIESTEGLTRGGQYPRASYSRYSGRIIIGDDLDVSYIPGRLSHEGTHLVQHQEGQIYGFLSEREAFNNAYAVDSELLGEVNAFNPTDEWIKSTYGF